MNRGYGGCYSETSSGGAGSTLESVTAPFALIFVLEGVCRVGGHDLIM